MATHWMQFSKFCTAFVPPFCARTAAIIGVSVGDARGRKEQYMGTRNDYRRSGLFLVRIWAEQAEDGNSQVECHGKVQRVVDGEARHFGDWQALIGLLIEMSREKYSTTQKSIGGQYNE
jgi:hypothetical protein